jgi:hypothetical protein
LNAFPEMLVMKRTVLGRIIPGGRYRRHGLRRTEEGGFADMDGGDYRVLDIAQELGIGRKNVVFIGLDGEDDSRLFVCSLAKFANAFRLIPEDGDSVVTVLQPEPPRIADNSQRGLGL